MSRVEQKTEKNTTIYVDHFQRVQVHQVKRDIHDRTIHVSNYLKNGNFLSMAKTEQPYWNEGMTSEGSKSSSSLEVGTKDSLTWGQKFHNMAIGLVFSTTTRATMNLGGGDREVFLGEWTLADKTALYWYNGMKKGKELGLKQEQSQN